MRTKGENVLEERYINELSVQCVSSFSLWTAIIYINPRAYYRDFRE
jgi:hypothetical protein